MKTALFIAKRYLVSKKNFNIINLLSVISIIGVSLATAALFVVLSVFNGFEDIIGKMMNNFDPDLKVVLAKGKRFTVTDSLRKKLESDTNIAFYSFVIEENVILEYQHKQLIATMLGVDENFVHTSGVDSSISSGSFVLYKNPQHFAVLGYGIAMRLGIAAESIALFKILAPNNVEGRNLSLSNAFNAEIVRCSGIFSIQEDYDEKYVIVDYGLASELLNYQNQASEIFIKLRKNINTEEAKKQLQRELGGNFKVLDRYEQQETLYKMMKSEHFIIFLIMSVILFISSFTIVGSVSMLIIEKRHDIATLFSLGASQKLIRQIFLFEGLLITFTGAIIGLILGLSLCLAQQYFGIVTFPTSGGFITNVYPVKILLSDVILIFATVLVIGNIISLYPVRYITDKLFNVYYIT